MLLAALVLVLFTTVLNAQPPAAAQKKSQPIRSYISGAWDTLTRTPLNCEAIIDPKLAPGESILYLPHGMSAPPEVTAASKSCKFQVRNLPQKITTIGEIDVRQIDRHGLLYLPARYVVPGGRFNEMYGWDSYFIVVGLVHDKRIDLAREMVDNFIFEIQNYGGILNANRTYYLTRSQPPFFTSMVLTIFDAEQQRGDADQQWLKRAYEAAKREHSFWTTGQHLAGNTGLSRYYDFGSGAVPEEAHNGNKYYNDVANELWKLRVFQYFEQSDKTEATNTPAFRVGRSGSSPSSAVTVRFSDSYYKGDRAMRESGFDISYRFGLFSADTHEFAPVCLNSLLYKYETDLARIATLLGNSQEAAQWTALASKRRETMRNLMFNEKAGMYFDHHFPSGAWSTYEFASTFYPLWAGLASPEEAAAVVRNLKHFEHAGGVAMSTTMTGLQWDAPYGWAPIQMIVVDGLRKYGYVDIADRIASKWLATVDLNYAREGTIREKYNVVTRSSDAPVKAGYKENVVGFGWTNGVYLHLRATLGKGNRVTVEPKAKSKAAAAGR